MNGSCAGGTGAFIDQMAILLDVSLEELNDLAKKHTRIYPIASRCGVFAKTDMPAAFESRRGERGYCCQYFSCSRQPDDRRLGTGA